MYLGILILVIFAFASNANALEGFGRCLFTGFDESRCKPHELKVSYNLFTNGNGGFRQLNAGDLSQCPDPSLPVKMIVHGWRSSASNKWVKDMNSAYFRKGNYNVIALDWSEPAHRIDYFASAVNTQCIGNMAGEFILKYLGQCGITPENIHIIGHSLGAHLAGFIGKYVSKETKTRKIGRISGLDMAGLCFVFESEQLSKNDALLVDVYHTDDDLLGSKDAVGHYDIYFNRGVEQPGCVDLKSKVFAIIEFLRGVFTCSHGRSHEYYLESINSNEFIASKCKIRLFKRFKIIGPKNVIIGENLSNNTSPGTYYLETNSKPPYAQCA